MFVFLFNYKMISGLMKKECIKLKKAFDIIITIILTFLDPKATADALNQ